MTDVVVSDTDPLVTGAVPPGDVSESAVHAVNTSIIAAPRTDDLNTTRVYRRWGSGLRNWTVRVHEGRWIPTPYLTKMPSESSQYSVTIWPGSTGTSPVNTSSQFSPSSMIEIDTA